MTYNGLHFRSFSIITARNPAPSGKKARISKNSSAPISATSPASPTSIRTSGCSPIGAKLNGTTYGLSAKDTGITNDANLYATETINNLKCPLELHLGVITVSQETNKIVEGLPELEI